MKNLITKRDYFAIFEEEETVVLNTYNFKLLDFLLNRVFQKAHRNKLLTDKRIGGHRHGRLIFTGDPNTTVPMIYKFLQESLPIGKIKNFVTVTSINPTSSRSEGSQSEIFYSYCILFTKDCNLYYNGTNFMANKGDYVYIVDAVTPNTIVGDKQLTPEDMLAHKTTFNSYFEYKKHLEQQIFKKYSDKQIKYEIYVLLNKIMDVIDKEIPTQGLDITNIYQENIGYYLPFDKNYIEGITLQDLNAVNKNFGELIIGLFLLKNIKDTYQRLEFPLLTNNPNQDLIFNGINVSVKSRKGSSNSLVPILSDKKLEDAGVCKKFKKLVSYIKSKDILQIVFGLNKALNTQGWNIITNDYWKFPKDPSKITRNWINNRMKEMFGDTNIEYLRTSLQSELYSKIERGSEVKDLYLKDLDKLYGLVVYSLQQHLVDALNGKAVLVKGSLENLEADLTYKVDLNKFLKMQPLLSFNFRVSESSIRIYGKSFSNKEFKWYWKSSTGRPMNSKIGFK